MEGVSNIPRRRLSSSSVTSSSSQTRTRLALGRYYRHVLNDYSTALEQYKQRREDVEKYDDAGTDHQGATSLVSSIERIERNLRGYCRARIVEMLEFEQLGNDIALAMLKQEVAALDDWEVDTSDESEESSPSSGGNEEEGEKITQEKGMERTADVEDGLNEGEEETNSVWNNTYELAVQLGALIRRACYRVWTSAFIQVWAYYIACILITTALLWLSIWSVSKFAGLFFSWIWSEGAQWWQESLLYQGISTATDVVSSGGSKVMSSLQQLPNATLMGFASMASMVFRPALPEPLPPVHLNAPLGDQLSDTIHHLIQLNEVGLHVSPATSLLSASANSIIGAADIVRASHFTLKTELSAAYSELERSLNQAVDHLRDFDIDSQSMLTHSGSYLKSSLHKIEKINGSWKRPWFFARWLTSFRHAFNNPDPVTFSSPATSTTPHQDVANEFLVIIHKLDNELRHLLLVVGQGEAELRAVIAAWRDVNVIQKENGRIVADAQDSIAAKETAGLFGFGITIGPFGRMSTKDKLLGRQLRREAINLSQLESAHLRASEGLKSAKILIDGVRTSLRVLANQVQVLAAMDQEVLSPNYLEAEIKSLLDLVNQVDNARRVSVDGRERISQFWRDQSKKCRGAANFDDCFYDLGNRIADGL